MGGERKNSAHSDPQDSTMKGGRGKALIRRFELIVLGRGKGVAYLPEEGEQETKT